MIEPIKPTSIQVVRDALVEAEIASINDKLPTAISDIVGYLLVHIPKSENGLNPLECDEVCRRFVKAGWKNATFDYAGTTIPDILYRFKYKDIEFDKC